MLYAGVSDAFDVGSLAGSIQHTHKDLLGRFTGNLGQEDLAYFMKWDRLVDLEAQANANQISDAWLVDSLEREKTTLRSMSSLDLIPMNNGEARQVSDGTTVLISFQRSHLSSQQMSLENLNFERGCSVIVSTDDTTASPSRSSNRPHMHIVRGTFEQASVNLVTIRASRDDLSRLERTVRRWKAPGQPSFRIDRDEIATGIGTLRQNLVNLFSRDDILPGDESSLSNRLAWLRDVIVRLRAPAFDIGLKLTMFDPPTATVQCSFPGCDLMDLYMEYAELNGDQQAAVDSALTARDYSMIQGLPGTGKTSTIAFVTRLLVAHGKRVLITSYTNSAVDNVLLKLTQSGLAATGPSNLSPSVIRVGRESTTHPGIQPILASSAAFALEKAYEAEADVPQCLPSADCLARCIQAARVVGVTALTLPKSPLLAREYFDVVIVDEAGQITQPAVIGAMMAANTFVLVGDHMQLPPLVASELAEMGGKVEING
jgi:DNA replication ATP-dependent helicase Dna2